MKNLPRALVIVDFNALSARRYVNRHCTHTAKLTEHFDGRDATALEAYRAYPNAQPTTNGHDVA